MKVLYRIGFISVVLLLSFLFTHKCVAQTLAFELKTAPELEFDFNTIDKYTFGITKMDAVILNIKAEGVRWDLKVGADTSDGQHWDVKSEYSTTGETPPIDILQLRFRNASNTSLITGFFTITDKSSPVYIIGTPNDKDTDINCPNQGTNTEGDYQTSPGCYRFNVDIKIVPGLNPIYKAGSYYMQINYMLVEDL